MGKNKNLNQLIFEKLVVPYLDKLELSSSRSNVDIAFIKQLNIFDNAKINRLVDADKKKLTDTFNECYKTKNFKKFAQLINDFAPESTGAGIVAFSSAYQDIVNQNRSEEQIRKLEEIINKGNENFSYKKLIESLDKGLITRIIERIHSNNTLKRVNSAKGTGLSGLQFAQLLTGAYYAGDVYSNNEQTFKDLREIESLLFQGNKKVVANKKLLHSLGFDDNLFENEEGEYTRALNKISEDIERHVATSGFFKDRRSVQLEEYSLQEILDLNKDLKVLKSALSIDFVKSYLGLEVSDNFKDLNKLTPAQRKQLEVLLRTSKDEKLNTRMDTLQKFAEVIDKSVDDYCNDYKNILEKNVTKDEVKHDFIEALAKRGSFASKDIEEFTNSALFVASEVGQKFISPKFSNQIVKKDGDSRRTIVNVMYNGKYYYLSDYNYTDFYAKLDEKYPNDCSQEQHDEELLKDIRQKLASKYNCNFNNLNSRDDVVLEVSFLTATMLKNAQKEKHEERTHDTPRNKYKEKHYNDTENTEEREEREESREEREEVNYINNDKNSNEIIFTSSQIYREAYENAYKEFMSYYPIKPREEVSKRGEEIKPEVEEEKPQPEKKELEQEEEKPEQEEEKPEQEEAQDNNNKEITNQFISNIENIKIVSIKGIQELNISNEEKENYVNRINTLCLNATNTVKNENKGNFADLFAQVGNDCNKILREAKDSSKNRQANVQFQQNIEKIKKEVEDLKSRSISSLESNISDSEICKKYVSQTENLCNDFIKNIEELSIKGTVVKSYTELAKKCLAVYSLAVRESKQKSKADLHKEEVFKGGVIDEKHFTTHQHETDREELDNRVVRREQSSQVHSLIKLKQQKIAEARQIQRYYTFNSPLSEIFADYPDEITEQQVQEIENKCNEYFEQLKSKKEEESKKPPEKSKKDIDIVKSADVRYEEQEKVGLSKDNEYYTLTKNEKTKRKLNPNKKKDKPIIEAFENEING